MGIDGSGADEDGDADAKYVKRQSALQRSIKRFLPAAFQPTLPVTTRSANPKHWQRQISVNKIYTENKPASPKNLIR